MEFGAPRVCGDDPCYLPWAAGASHVLPAYAGMIPNEGYGVNHDRGAPRVCGDDPRLADLIEPPNECSPRMRG